MLKNKTLKSPEQFDQEIASTITSLKNNSNSCEKELYEQLYYLIDELIINYGRNEENKRINKILREQYFHLNECYSTDLKDKLLSSLRLAVMGYTKKIKRELK